MEVELMNIQKATSSDCWSLASNQYPCGKFPKVSIGITIPRTSSVLRGRDATCAAAFERNLSQGTDGRSTPPKIDNASLQVSPEAANLDGCAKEVPKPVPSKVSVSQPDDNTCEHTGTFSFGTRQEHVSHLDHLERPPFVSSQGKLQVEPGDKNKPNSEVLRMKLWEILGGTSQNKEACASPNPEDIETPYQPKSQTANGPSSQSKHVFTSPFPDNIKTPAQLNCQTVNFKCKPSSDPIESDSDSPQVVEVRPIPHLLGRKKAPAASKQQDKKQSGKKPLSTHRSAPKQKMLDNVFAFSDKCTPKTAGKSANGDSGSLRNLRSLNGKAKVEPKKAHCSDRISDKTTQDDKEGILAPRNAPSENKAYFLEEQGKKSSIPPHQEEHDNTHIPEASDRSPHANTAAGNSFNSAPSSAANPASLPKKYSWEHDASTEINGKFGEVASPLADRFRDLPDDFESPTFAANVKISPQRSKILDDDLFSSKHPKNVNRSRSTSFAWDPESEPSGEMDKTNVLHGSESPNTQEERHNRKQPPLSPLSAIEDEGNQSSIPSFIKG
ncbi:hypothetical protein GUJ93_ZPchr0012g21559 [Zizania palustris]|nr:hypothetical protein GUJ93_ZPchr0012g21559 [Zizania palustris]